MKAIYNRKDRAGARLQHRKRARQYHVRSHTGPERYFRRRWTAILYAWWTAIFNGYTSATVWDMREDEEQ